MNFTGEMEAPSDNEREELRKLGSNDFVIYGEDKHGDIHPIATVIKHPNCPEGWYEWLYEKMKWKNGGAPSPPENSQED